jgi:uncharacterized membrane-anchored protein YjiN (DUF445 family)
MDADERRRKDLRRMKLVATALLALAAIVYVLTLPGEGWLGFVNTAAEAAMVGAIADWFAVTALFRHPLGIPIPHTAIIPTRKDALGRNLEEFVATNFLAEDVVRGRVARAQVARRTGVWLSDRAHAERVTSELASLARGALTVLRDETVVAVLDEVFLRKVLRRPWGPPAGRLLSRIVADGAHHRLVDVGVEQLYTWLSEHEDVIVRIVLERAPAWTPNWVDHRVAQRAYTEAVRFVADVRADPDHRVRKALDDLLSGFGNDLQHDPETMARADAFRERMLEHPDVRGAVAQLWTTVRRVLEEAVDDPGSDLRLRTADGLVSLGRRLVDDVQLQGVVDRYVEDAVGYVVTSYRDEVVTVISETVQRWDAAEASRRIELHVGRDLQFIRINGTVVGGLAGLLIHTVTVLLS